MNNVFLDEISFQYWYEHKEMVKKTEKDRVNSKSFSCVHNGYDYGLKEYKTCFVYKDGQSEFIIDEKDGRDRDLKNYYILVEHLCNDFGYSRDKFLNDTETHRLYSMDEVEKYSDSEIEHALINYRIKNKQGKINEQCAILVDGQKYYIPHNFNHSVRFDILSDAMPENERKKWYIRILSQIKPLNNPIKITEELESINEEHSNNFKVTIDASDVKSKRNTNTNNKKRTDYVSLNTQKKSIGDLGESIILEYEKNKLAALGLNDLVDKVEHTSKEVGDNEGYDIKSFDSDGKDLFIEVKSTRQKTSGGFYVSQNEIDVSNEKIAKGELYFIYRLYGINSEKGEARLKIYEPPFNEDRYTMKVVSWFIE